MNCEIFREMIGSYVDETLEEGRRHWFRTHLRECPTCRESALREEPSLLFAMAPAAPGEPEAIEACAAAVMGRIRQDRLERRLHRRRPWMAVAAAATLVISGGIAWRTMISGGSGTLQPVVEGLRDAELQQSPPTVEVEMSGEDVRVYQFANDANADTAVYFIVDPALEL
ncbi:MAG: zf-HC2 domain-containing protein [Thermoanaerobaculales bacterium]|nr:zf-HC2 domain-containing protein [Thermoanaerobaculales bacterium]